LSICVHPVIRFVAKADTPMETFSPFWTDRPVVRLDQQSLYLHLHSVIVFVRDQERSLRFYLDQLGFRLVVDHSFASGDRWIQVAPPDGTANLALIAPKPDSEDMSSLAA
jgi:hypothetical protein